MLNIYGIKTVSSLVVYLTFDDCDMTVVMIMLKWRQIRLTDCIDYSIIAFSILTCILSFFVCFNCSCHSVRMSCWNKRLLTSLTYIAQLLPIGLFFRLLCCYWLWRTVQGTVLPQQKIVEFLHPTLWVFIDKRIAKINRHIHVHRLQRCKF